MGNVIKFENLEVDVLIGIANESAEQVEASARKAVEHAERSGRALIAIKEKLPHGEWSGWLGKNFDYSQEHARRYMTIASNSTRVLNLKDATSIREALRMIADDPDTPKRERKPSVEVIEVAADEPRDIASEVAAECGVTRDQIIRDGEYAEAVNAVSQADPDIRAKVRSGKVTQDDVIAAAKPAKPQQAATATAEPEMEKKSPTVTQIQRSLFKMGADKKRHKQLIQIAGEAVHRMPVEHRIEFLASTVVWLGEDEQRLLRDAVREKQDALDAEAESYGK